MLNPGRTGDQPEVAARARVWQWKGDQMANLDVQSSAGAVQSGAGMTQWQRVGNIFVAPSKTFEDIKRGNRSWWLPFLISVIFTYVLFAGITMKIGWQQVAQNNMAMSPRQAERLEQLSPDQHARSMKLIGVFTEVVTAASPVFILVGACIISLILWGTINFGFGGKSTFPEIFAVNMYAFLPRIVLPMMATAAIFAGLAPESFNMSNMAATNAAYFLSVQDTNKALYALLSQIDIISIWVAVLLSIGIAKVAGKKSSAGFISVFGWWCLWILIRVLIAFVAS